MAQVLVRGVDVACRRILISRLLNRGNKQEKAEALAASLLPLALKFWQKRTEYYQTNPEPGGDHELPFSNAFGDLTKLVDKIILQDGNIAQLETIIESMNEIDQDSLATLS